MHVTREHTAEGTVIFAGPQNTDCLGQHFFFGGALDIFLVSKILFRDNRRGWTSCLLSHLSTPQVSDGAPSVEISSPCFVHFGEVSLSRAHRLVS